VTGYTHLSAGALAGAVIGRLAGEPLLGAAVGAVAALLPDIDHPGSLVGRRVPVLPALLSVITGHRTVTHTVWFCLAVAAGAGVLAVSLAGWAWAWLSAPTFCGALSHLLLDGCTRSGVRPFAPLPMRGKLARVEHVQGPLVTGDPLTEVPVALLALAAAAWAAGLV